MDIPGRLQACFRSTWSIAVCHQLVHGAADLMIGLARRRRRRNRRGSCGTRPRRRPPRSRPRRPPWHRRPRRRRSCRAAPPPTGRAACCAAPRLEVQLSSWANLLSKASSRLSKVVIWRAPFAAGRGSGPCISSAIGLNQRRRRPSRARCAHIFGAIAASLIVHCRTDRIRSGHAASFRRSSRAQAVDATTILLPGTPPDGFPQTTVCAHEPSSAHL